MEANPEVPGIDKPEKVPDAFEIDNINLMVYFLAKRFPEDVVNEILEYLNKLSLHYTQAVEKIEMLQDHVNTDPRTGLLRYQEQYFENIFKNVSRIFSGYVGETERYHLSYVRLDIDDFSKFNNLYGHEVGDEVLKKVGDIINGTVRPTDFGIRYGGEELDIILTATSLAGATTFLTKLYENFRKLSIVVKGKSIPVSLSAGVSHVELPYREIVRLGKEKTEDLHKMIQKEADDALYEAKLLGKARYCIYEEKRASEYEQIRSDYQKSKLR